MASSSRRHHYVPQFYLKSFVREDTDFGFWVYDKREPQTPRFQTPKNTAVRSHFYSFDGPEGRHDQVEKLLAVVEGASKPILERWQARHARPQFGEAVEVAQFLALMLTRVPRSQAVVREIMEAQGIESLKSLLETPDKLAEALERYARETGKAAPSIDKAIDSLQNFENRFKIGANERYALAFALSSSHAMVQQLLRMNWCICVAPSGTFFITSDCPLTIFTPHGHRAQFGGGLALPQTQVSFPLSPHVCLFLDRRGNNLRRPVGRKFVHEINRRTAFAAEHFVISPYRTRQVEEIVREGGKSLVRPKMDRGELLKRMKARRLKGRQPRSK
jgi:hypothetical protein